MIEKLCNAFGPSGWEDEVREIIKANIEPYADKVWVDKMGNLYAYKDGSKKGKSLVVSAHMDEVGFMVSHIGDEGTVCFDTLGGIDPSVVSGKRIVIGNKRIPAVISSKAIHMQTPEERKQILPIDKMHIDVGASTKEEAESLVNVGDVAVFAPNYEIIGDGYIKSKAIDDRLGCGALIEVLKKGVEYPTYFAFVTREEIGCRGASAAAYMLQTDLAVIAECTTASDIYGTPPHEKVCCLDSGPAVSFMDRATVYDVELFRNVCHIADSKELKYQIKNVVAGGNDSSAYQRSATGT
ncbi:MAG TPA: M42 family peptidase, partial [Bacillota bacterium]|nr:M42 family peptidase [Bacillota bacterium]